jgi:hypothetical protein
MKCVLEAQSEFKRRAELLVDVLVSDVARLVTEYAVTEYQLFEESLLRHYHIKAEDKGAEPLPYRRLVDIKHPFMLRYCQYLEQNKFSDQYAALRHALITVRGADCCNRAACYYEYSGICTCNRPIFDRDIRTGLVSTYF